MNVTILAGLVITLTARALGMRKGAIVAAIVIAFYTILVGADAAVVGPALMGGLLNPTAPLPAAGLLLLEY